jgi:hypothetical protein
MPSLITASTTGSSGLNVMGLVILAVIFALLYPLQRRFRAWASRRRIERWEHDDLLQPRPPVDEPPPDASADASTDASTDASAERRDTPEAPPHDDRPTTGT